MISRAVQLLAVYPNPYMALDGFGNAAGAFAVDPGANPNRAFVGAEISHVDILDTLEKGDLRSPRQDTFWKFELSEPTMIPITPYYVDALRNGYLFPATQEVADKAGVEFKSLDVYLYEASVKARMKWKQDYMQDCPLPAHSLNTLRGANSNTAMVDELSFTSNKKVEPKK